MDNNALVKIRAAKLPADIQLISQLWMDYLTWGNDQMKRLYKIHTHHPAEAVENDIILIDKFLPPQGACMLAFQGDKCCGTGCLKRINDDVGEIKRMYVSPSARQMGAGRAILQSLIDAARMIGYKSIRLDSPKFMEAAHALYRKFGFRNIAEYDEVEIPKKFRQHLIFMELDLAD